jgi:hypothetical protein
MSDSAHGWVSGQSNLCCHPPVYNDFVIERLREAALEFKGQDDETGHELEELG